MGCLGCFGFKGTRGNQAPDEGDTAVHSAARHSHAAVRDTAATSESAAHVSPPTERKIEAEPQAEQQAVLNISSSEARAQPDASTDTRHQALAGEPAVRLVAPCGSYTSSPTAVERSAGNVPAASGLGSLPVLGTSNKVQEWLSSSASDHVSSHDPGGAASSTATPAGGTIESNGLLCESPAVDAQSGDVRRGVPATCAPGLHGDAETVQPLAPLIKTPLPGQAAASNSSSSADDADGSSHSNRGVGSPPGVPKPALVDSSHAALPIPGLPFFPPRVGAVRPGQHRFPATASAPVNSTAGIDNVLSLLRQHTAAARDGDQGHQSHDNVLQDVSAVVSSLQSNTVNAGVEALVGSTPDRNSTNDAPSRDDSAEDPASLLPISGASVNPAVPSIRSGAVKIPDMQKQIAKMFLNNENQSVPVEALSMDAQSGWSPPSLAVNEQDGMSSSSSMSIVTPLRVHTDAASQPYLGAPLPAVEGDRMDHLCSLNILGTSPERRFDRLTGLAATVFSVPIVLVSLVDKERQWFKSVMGLPGVTETDRHSSFCAWTLLPQCPECLVVSDARNDARFRNNKLVTGPPHIQFYAGCPLVSSNGMRLGSLCIIDAHTRYFTNEDCNLLSNFAEIAVREVEAQRAETRLAYKEEPDEVLRSRQAWDVGILCLHVVNGCWVVRLANDRAAELLGTADADAFIGQDFWEVVSLRDGMPPAGELFRQQLLEGADFTTQVKAYTDAGRKMWLSCTFTSGTLSQLDDQCPVVSVPMDISSEPGTKAAYWFATLQPVVELSPTMGAFGNLKPSGAGDVAESTAESNLMNTEYACHFDAECLQDITSSSKISQTLQSVLLHVLHAPSSVAAGASGAGEYALAELLSSHDPGASLAALQETHTRWAALGLPQHAVLDILRMDSGDDMAHVLRRLPMPICMSLRTAMHEGIFKNVPDAKQLHEGVCAVDTDLVVDTLLYITRAVERMHAAGSTHGDICDATLVATMAAPKAAPGVRWQHGRDMQVSFATLGAAVRAGHPVHLSALETVRPDLVLFYAPERFDAAGWLDEGTPAGDIWALGMLLIYCMRLSLPLVNDGLLALQSMARMGTLLQHVLQFDEQPMPVQLKTLITLCLKPDPASRPTASRLAAALEHIQEVLAQPQPEE